MSEDFRPLVTVVIPVYNKADTVARSIESVKAQTVSNFECFVVNDGSTDNSKEVVLKAIAGDKRFRYIEQKNMGVAIARNKGVFSGSAPYVCCLDADDAIDPAFLEVCIDALERDRSIGIAYTGLWYIKDNGEQGLSSWPGQFDYDKQLEGYNQIPTCNVARREVWERLGGQRQRYAPEGAGEEDAEMWLRAGAIGFGAKKVTDAGLFIYSWRTGLVSGNKNHVFTDWRAWHPYVFDGKHPFASVATPRRISHPVMQYDEPIVSVIIPVSREHQGEVFNAIDSLEAQSFRKWEAIIVDDSGDASDISWQESIRKAYPFVRFAHAKKRGAGAARNAGVKIARAPLLLFLDADDWLHPDAISDMLSAYNMNRAIIYSDYVGKVIIDKKSVYDSYKEKVLHYDDKIGEATIQFYSADYDCEKAVIQPSIDASGYPYVWCLVSCLVPKKWHDEIGGFDEQMISWEDWDYWIRMARAGKCFTRINKSLVAYRFYSGTRRESGLHAASDLIKYLVEKYKGEKAMPCNCGKGSAVRFDSSYRNEYRGEPAIQKQETQSIMNEISDDQMVLCIYNSLNVGDHRVIGVVTGIDYGYRGGGSRFYVHKKDIAAQPDLFKPVAMEEKVEVDTETDVMETPPPTRIVPKSSSDSESGITTPDMLEGDLQSIPGISAIHAQKLNAAGVYTFEDLVKFGAENLTKMKGIGEKRAALIIEAAMKKLNQVPYG